MKSPSVQLQVIVTFWFSCPLNGMEHFVSFPFMICLFSLHNLFIFLARFPSISNPFYVCPVFVINLHVAVYQFYRPHMQVSSLHVM